MSEIFCIRHGQASFAADDYDQLSSTGYRQGELLGQHLVKSGLHFDRFLAGSLKRQIQTAEAVQSVYQHFGLDSPEIEIDPRWNELQVEQQVKLLAPQLIASQPELAPLLVKVKEDKKALQKLIRATFDFWIENPALASELETWSTAQQRVLAALNDLQQSNQQGAKAAVFTSGGIIAVISAHVLGLADNGVYPLFEKVINCSITRLLHNRQRMALSTFNEYAYMTAMAAKGEEKTIITYR